MKVLPLLCAVLLFGTACSRQPSPERRNDTAAGATPATPSDTPAINRGNTMGMKISSSAFIEGAAIPAKYTCDGESVSPPLAWSSLPDGTHSLALIVDDPDAPSGTWVHWVLYNLPPEMTGIDENVAMDAVLHNSGRQGVNDFRKHGYGGPCPPNGTHRYFFKLYALDAMLPLEGDVTKDRLIQAMTEHILAEVELIGKYERAK